MTALLKHMRGPIVVAIIIVALAGGVAAWLVFDPAFRTGTSKPSGPQDKFERRVKDYILNNPEVILEAMQRLDKRQRAAENEAVRGIIATRAKDIFQDPDTPVGGNPNGDATVVEFFDYNCPYCRAVAPTMVDLERADPKLRFVYKEFPILGPNSVFAAKAALAAQRQGKYVEFHRALITSKGPVNEERVMTAAAEVGIDRGRLKMDMEDPTIKAAIDRNLELARVLRITGTPSFVVGEAVRQGVADLPTLQTMVAKVRKQE